MNPLAILGLLLAISMAGNAFLGNAYLSQRDKAVTGEVKTEQATGVAQACSKGVDELAVRADERKKLAAAAMAEAKKQARTLDRQADAILATPPAAPGDDCASAQRRLDDWWEKKP